MAELTEPILIRIFSHLNINDRKNASLTCKNWSRILNSACLWRSVVCLFFSEPGYEEPFEKGCKLTKCLPLVRHCAAWIQELTIKFYEGPDDNEENLNIMKTFIDSCTLRFQEIYHSSLLQLPQCTYLTLPYETVGKHSMRVIANNCPLLILLTLSIETNLRIDLRDNPMVSEDTWKEVLEKNPQLKVAVQIGIFAANSEDLRTLLPPTIPLIGVRALQRPLHRKTIIHLHKFKAQLRSLELVCGGSKYFITSLVNSCANLTMFKLMIHLSRVDLFDDLNIQELRGLKRVSFFLKLHGSLEQRGLAIKEEYKSMWSSNQYYLEIFTNPEEDIYKFKYEENFCRQLYLAI